MSNSNFHAIPPSGLLTLNFPEDFNCEKNGSTTNCLASGPYHPVCVFAKPAFLTKCYKATSHFATRYPHIRIDHVTTRGSLTLKLGS